MGELQSKVKDIAASLWMKPASLEELHTRDFCKNMNQYGLFTLPSIGKKRGWIYEKNDRYYCYKKTVEEVLNPDGYELFIKTDDEKSEFVKSFEKYNKLN